MLLSNHSNSESSETNESTESSNSPIVEPSKERADLKFLAAAKAWKKKDESNENNSHTPDSEVESQTTESADNETN